MTGARLGIIMLCHTALPRAAQVARFWLQAGCPVVMHVDRAVPARELDALRADLGEEPLLRFCPRHRCEWGSWNIVRASQDAAEVMLRDFPEVGHVLLSSGACLPLRPAEELIGFLRAQPETDFIESVAISHASWIMGGLSEERFTLYFPFSWRRQRWLFDKAVEVQRRLGIRREVPRPLAPHMGSQWWCLTRRTLQTILTDPRRPRYERYFRRNWIPDESYFQTLVRLHSDRIENRSLTLAKFDRNGRPYLFYDDHLHLLRRSDAFLARKIWPGADKLYDVFLSQKVTQMPPVPPEPAKIDRYFELAEKQRFEGRAGLYMQSRFPPFDVAGTARTAGPYAAFSGFDHVFENFEHWLGQVTGTRPHGHLYAPERVQFHGGVPVWHGAISASAALRDYNPYMFLTNLLWATRGEVQCFSFGPEDTLPDGLVDFMTHDPNGRLSVITGAYLLPLYRGRVVEGDLLGHIGVLHLREQAWLGILRSRWAQARLHVVSLGEILSDPAPHLEAIVKEMGGEAGLRAHGLPARRSIEGFDRYLAELRDKGLPPAILKDCQR